MVDTEEWMKLDATEAVERIVEALRRQVAEVLGRRGVVVAMSGGVDSSVCAALAVRALGRDRVLGLHLPEPESSPESHRLAREWAAQLGIEFVVEDIGPILEACGCYRRRDEAIRSLVPEFGPGWGCKVVLPANRLETSRLNVSSLVVQPPGGAPRTLRLPPAAYRAIVAATNFKQRIRKSMEYHYADSRSYAVVGTPNRLEYDQGFFVKGGDGLADVKPIAHLYKTQVYQLGGALSVSEEILRSVPTTDTYSLPQTQEEFYFALPARTLDLFLWAYVHGWGPERAAAELGYSADEVRRVYRDIEWKRAATRHLHLAPLLVEGLDPLPVTAV